MGREEKLNELEERIKKEQENLSKTEHYLTLLSKERNEYIKKISSISDLIDDNKDKLDSLENPKKSMSNFSTMNLLLVFLYLFLLLFISKFSLPALLTFLMPAFICTPLLISVIKHFIKDLKNFKKIKSAYTIEDLKEQITKNETLKQSLENYKKSIYEQIADLESLKIDIEKVISIIKTEIDNINFDQIHGLGSYSNDKQADYYGKKGSR